ncbi:hypothetical protein ACROYT_G028003 [Oculina patagonica]
MTMLRRWSCQVYFALFLILFCQTTDGTESRETTVSHYRDKTTQQCSWSCKFNESDLRNRINMDLADKKLPIALRFWYLKEEDEKCVNQTSHNSSREDTKQRHESRWQIWLVNNKLPSSVNNAIQRFSLLVFAYSNRRHFIKANCTLLKSTNSHNLDGEISPDDHFEKILRSTVTTQGQLCNTKVQRNDIQASVLGVTNILMYAAVGIMILDHQLAVTFVLSQENLPCVACCVLLSYYLWSSYRSFTEKYEDLALKLFELHEQIKYGQQKTPPDLTVTPGNEVFTQENQDTWNSFVDKLFQQLPDCLRNIAEPCNTPDSVKRIPKELFEKACGELMPIRKGICITLLKAALSVIFVYFAFSLTMHMKSSPVLTTLMTLVAGSFPKIVIIYINRWRQKHFKACIEKKAQEIVQEYINKRCSCNQGRTYRDFDSQVWSNNFVWVYTAILISLIPYLSLLLLYIFVT